MLETLKNNYLIFSITLLFIGVNGYLLFDDFYYLYFLPLFLVITYLCVFHIKTAFLLMIFFTPISVNVEEFTEGRMGLFLPTEPLIFGLMLLIIFKEIRKPILPKEFWTHPITLSLGFYLVWVLITSITSSQPIVSFKFLLMKTWYILPCLTIGAFAFANKNNIAKFLWCYSIGMVIAILYTLIRHAGYDFGEQEGHWVMSPLFKDHTIYGAAVAINFFFVLGLLFHKKHSVTNLIILLVFFVITAIGLYFSYTRAAWLSVIVAFCVWICIKYKIKFKYLFTIALVLSVITFLSWDQIQMQLEKNKFEHTTENFEERIQSAANISSDASNLERINRWTAAWNMFTERPVFGFGPATYAFEYAPYQDPEKHTIISTNFGDAGNAHSEYLGPLAEMGLLGFIAILLFVIALFNSGIRLLIDVKRFMPEDTSFYTLLFFIILAMTTYFFHGILNNYLDTDKIAIPVYGTAALIITQSIRIGRLKEKNLLKNKEA